ncbi:hypothetical protein [Phaeocystidibacter marisrubri]|uniref:Uncharacterized protein n=1 Tax=Phaeocystidibacter marisrubri TaxID=1577780 RepID=A0A6L3ZJK4_9FLAO|nr:hypothetical protein [Phaeocystidibacter marisrubri]KAB2818124.1 hypothetical protein F8C82_06895 [Phaeocystidibacter marisrubri]GGH71836.1 hypothetical protein GCM10011318_15190 [Phaeocystidibacter marisrubri]
MFEAYVRTGPYNNRSYELIDVVQLNPTVDDPYVLEGTLAYEGVHPVTIELAATEELDVDAPSEFSNPFHNGAVDFDAELGVNEFEVYYYPNFWVNLKVYSKRSLAELKGGNFSIGNGRNSLVTTYAYLVDRENIGDTVENTGMAYLSLGKSAPLYLIGGSQDGADSLLVPLAYPNFRHMDTTFVFFDADDGTYSISY